MTLKEAKARKALTLQDLREIDSEFLIPVIVAKVLHCDPYAINVQAHADASKLGYKVSIQGRRVRIPRLAFIQYMEGEDENH